MSVESCSSQISAIFSAEVWYGYREKQKEVTPMIGQRIAALRKNARMSQAELARALGVSPSAVGMYEQGRREPAAATLVQLAKVFRVSTDYLLTGRMATPEDARLLVQAVDALVDGADRRLERRPDRPFTRRELAALFAAMLLEP